jgi:hypothetical protein
MLGRLAQAELRRSRREAPSGRADASYIHPDEGDGQLPVDRPGSIGRLPG